MSRRHGATPEDLDLIGTTLENQVAVVETIMSEVNRQFVSADWEGPARDSFEDQWNNQFMPALRQLNEAFTGTGKQCHSRADGTRAVLGRVM